MPARRFGLFTAFWLVVALSVYGGVHLFQLRFERGDVYAEYSSLRSDPLGTRAFYQSLEQVGNVEVSRNILPLSRLALDTKRTLIFAGLRHSNGLLEDAAWRRPIEHLLGSGSRVVMCFYPYEGRTSTAKSDKQEANKPDGAEEKKRSEELALGKRRLAQRWGVELETGRAVYSQGKPLRHSTVSLQADADLPETLSWHSQLFFAKLSPEWRVIYRRDDKPVLIERPVGSGTLVLAGDSYFLSNEALWKDRQPRLLAWLIGPHQQVVFDETNLGVREDPGVMSLVRKYRLHGLFAGLFLLAGLFVWKNMSSLVPPATSPAETDVGRDSAAGFVNLLRRSIPVSKVIPVCVRQWEKSLPGGSPERARVGHVRALMAETETKSGSKSDAVSTYQAICKVLERKSMSGA